MAARIVQGPNFNNSPDVGTFGQFFFDNAEKYKDRICQIDGTTNETETYASAKLRSTRVAIALQKKGIVSDDVVAFCSANTIDNTIPILATFYLGAKVANLEPSLSVRHTKHLLDIITPKVIFVEELAVKLIEQSLIKVNCQPEIIVFGTSTKYQIFSDLLKPQETENEFRPVEVDPEHDAYLLFSSGTTGLPKAITHSHKSFLWVTLQTFASICHDCVFHFTSFYWLTAIMMLITSFEYGSCRIFSRDPSPERVFTIIEKYKVSCIFAPPLLAYKLTNFENVHKYDVSSVKVVLCAGTPMAAPQVEKTNSLFSSAVTLLLYGMSEIGVVTIFDLNSDKELIVKKLGSCGRPAPGVLLKIVDPESGKMLGPHQKGEIRIKSPSVMKGYYKIDSSHFYDEDGFVKTGDVGFYDEDGCIYAVERIKEMFKYQSWHIIPSAIEAVLLEHPTVKEAVVVGVPCGEEGEVPAACVVLKCGETLSEEEIDSFLKERVADRERLRGGVTFLDSLPKTPSGKLIRKEVRDFVINRTC